MKVKVYSTQMGERELETQATTWGDLQRDLMKAGISYNGMKTVIGETKVTLEADIAVLPDYDFTLFLMPVKTKSGAAVYYQDMSYKELRSAIHDIIEEDGDVANVHFNQDKNYTNKSTEDLRSLLLDYVDIVPEPEEVSVREEEEKEEYNSDEDENDEDSDDDAYNDEEVKEEIDEELEMNQTGHDILSNLSAGIALLKRLDINILGEENQRYLNVHITNLDYLYVKLAKIVTKNQILERQYLSLKEEFKGLL